MARSSNPLNETKHFSKILVVDDDPKIRHAVVRILKKHGHEVVSYPNGKKALEALEKENPNLVLTDYDMPGMSGEEMLQSIRKNFPDKELPAVLMTADMKHLARTEEIGVLEGIAKPFHIEDLLGAVDRLQKKIEDERN